MSRRKHRRRNPSNQTIMYVGLGIATVGVIYLLTKQQTAPQQIVAAQPASGPPQVDSTGQVIGQVAGAVGNAIGNYVDNQNSGG